MTEKSVLLDERHRDHLHTCGISDDVIAQRGYRSIAPGSIHDWRQLAPATHKDELLRRILHDGALAFPLFRCGNPEPYCWVLRPDTPRVKAGKPVKYEYPQYTNNIFDALPGYGAALADHRVDLWLTEGAKKADALATAYGHKIVPLNENGVWGWRSKATGLIDDLYNIVWEGRRVIIAPDGDVRHNRQVLRAIQRTVHLLVARGVREILICLLPQQKDDTKLGIDDYLGQGHTTQDLERHLVELEAIEHSARIVLMKHPQTGTPLYLPKDYDIQNKTLVKTRRNETTPLYTGIIGITALSKNLHTDEEQACVFWNGHGPHTEMIISRADLADTRGCSRQLAAKGAAIHPTNAKSLSTYLVEFIEENREQLPRMDYVERLGLIPQDDRKDRTPGLVLPAGTVGMDQPVRYQGREIRVGTDHDAYKNVLREVCNWSNTHVFWAVFALGLAGPLLARILAERNPVVYLTGTSGSGKTTLIQYTLGCYGKPTTTPLQHQCGSGTTTRVGMQQALTVTNGVPIFFDDVHMIEQKDALRIAGLIYDFANGQLRSYGTPDQKGGGGQNLAGTLFLAGEIVPVFDHAGTLSRTLLINCLQHLPLGVAAKSVEGLRRAQVLRTAWETNNGAGMFGLEICERAWAHWDTFTQDVAAFEQHPATDSLQAWRRIFAIAAATVNLTLKTIGMSKDVADMVQSWSEMYEGGQQQRDPADETFDRLITMLIQSEQSDNGTHAAAATWRFLHYERKLVAVQRVGDRYWRVLTTSPQFKILVGPFAVDQFGKNWLDQNLITVHTGGQISKRVFVHTGYAQCILLPDSHFRNNEL
jgi:energy-coupling factor transporter ATP-binding protein EcfA2